MDTSKYAESSFVDVDLIRSSPSKKAVVISEGENKAAEYNGEKYEKLELDVEVDGRLKKYSPNRDSVKNLNGAWGTDSKLWVGKVMLLSITKVRGRDCLIALPISTKE